MKIALVIIVAVNALVMIYKFHQKMDDEKIANVYSVKNTGNWVTFLKVYRNTGKSIETVRWGSHRFRKLMRMVEGRDRR